MNAYSFPEHVSVSDAGKAIITRILNLDPSKRPSLDETLEHMFFHLGNSIPKQLPASTLACPPSATYVRQFMPNSTNAGTKGPTTRFETTAPVNPGSKGGKGRDNLISTHGSNKILAGVKPTSAQPGELGYRKQATNGKKEEDKKQVESAAKCNNIYIYIYVYI